jgi:hypothetical protein
MRHPCTTVALFADAWQAAHGVHALQQAGFDTGRVSAIGRNQHREEQVTGFIDRGDGGRYWGRFGALAGCLGGAVSSSALLLFPGVGQVVIVGPLVNEVAGELVAAGNGALARTFASLRVAPEFVARYEAAIRAGRFALVMQGNRLDAAAARRTLEQAGALEVRQHVPLEDDGARPLQCTA